MQTAVGARFGELPEGWQPPGTSAKAIRLPEIISRRQQQSAFKSCRFKWAVWQRPCPFQRVNTQEDPCGRKRQLHSAALLFSGAEFGIPAFAHGQVRSCFTIWRARGPVRLLRRRSEER